MSKNELVINSNGETKRVHPSERVIFNSKKDNVIDEESILKHLIEAKRLYQEQEVGQKEATVELKPQYPTLPVYVWLNCDDHLGSVQVDYESFLRDYNIVRDTPNFFCISNGDEVDNFMITLGKCATGVYEDAINPNQQALLMQSLFKKLDNQDKMLAFSFGNHNQWLRGAGYKFENTWLRDFKCPVLNCGGLLRINYGSEEYKVAITHRYWGSSKLNPTNAAKRYMEHEHPSADVLFLGHTHQAESLWFRRDRETEYRYAIIGGTYKTNDEWGAEQGIGGRGQLGGMVLALRPDKRDILVYDSVERAKAVFDMELQIKEHARN
jgi:hypothetical protein